MFRAFSVLIHASQPYLHESRHLHAMRRARGCGGRFLNTKKPDTTNNTAPDKHTSSDETVSRNFTSSSSSGTVLSHFSRNSDSSMSNDAEVIESLCQMHPHQTFLSKGCTPQFPRYHLSKFPSLSEKMVGERDRNVNKLWWVSGHLNWNFKHKELRVSPALLIVWKPV